MSKNAIEPRQAQIIAAALAMADLALGGLLLFLSTQPELIPLLKDDESLRFIMAAVLGGVAVSSLGMSFVLKSVLMGRAQDATQRAQAVIVALAITDAAGVTGFLIGLLTGLLIPAFVLIGLSGGTKVFHWPTRASLER